MTTIIIEWFVHWKKKYCMYEYVLYICYRWIGWCGIGWFVNWINRCREYRFLFLIFFFSLPYCDVCVVHNISLCNNTKLCLRFGVRLLNRQKKKNTQNKVYHYSCAIVSLVACGNLSLKFCITVSQSFLISFCIC